MLDFEIMNKALKIAWIKRLTEHDDAAWKIIPEFAAAKYGGLSFLIECQYDVKYLSLDNLPPFYHALLKYWQEYIHEKVSENSDIQYKIIWNNSRILIGGNQYSTCLYFKLRSFQLNTYLMRIARFYLLTNSNKKRTLTSRSHFTMALSRPFQRNGKSY